jgi:DNA-binding phage protein
MAAIDLEGDNFVLIYSQAGNKNPREVKCWLMATIKSCVKVKLKQLLEETKEMRDIQDIAEKMGLTKKEIFYELWNQSAKNSKQDIDILLETEDYPTISTQVKNVIKK